VAFRYLSADQHPDTIPWGLFVSDIIKPWQTIRASLRLCQKGGLSEVGQRVPFDGTKIKANANAWAFDEL